MTPVSRFNPGLRAGRLETPPEGMVYQFKPDYPKFVTADVEFRHAADTEVYYAPGRKFDPRTAPRWPNFIYGKSDSGELKWILPNDAAVDDKPAGRLVGAAKVTCTKWVQGNGEQGRRIPGELIQGKAAADFPPVTFTLSDLSELKPLELKSTDHRGRLQVKVIKYADGRGRLELAGRTVERDIQCLLSFRETMPDNGVPGVGIEAFFTVRGKDLGLASLAEDEIDVRVGMRGTIASQP